MGLSPPYLSGEGKKITAKLNHKQNVNHVILMEDIEQGERVREFVIEGKTAKGWKPIFEGSCIGHKFIHQFEDMEVFAIRLSISASSGEPQIKSMQVFDVKN